MQKIKNIRLLIILGALVVMTIATYFLLNRKRGHQLIDDALMFSMVDVSEIDSVSIYGESDTTRLHFNHGEWIVNDEFSADPQKLTVLFAILNQVRAKRTVADAVKEQVDSIFNTSGRKVEFYEGSSLVKEFFVAGHPESGTSYFRKGDKSYIVTIPGYRSYLSALFLMRDSGWRGKLIFEEVSWNNLEKVEINYPEKPGFSIVPSENFYTIQGQQVSDSLKILDYLDRVSLLMADNFLEGDEVEAPDTLPLIKIAVSDIRKRPFELSVFPAKNNSYHLALKDSVYWLHISKDKIEPLVKDRSYFN